MSEVGQMRQPQYDPAVFHSRAMRAKAIYVQAFEDEYMPLVAQKLRECHTLENLVCCSHCARAWWTPAHCDLRICPVCARRLSRDRYRIISALTHAMKFPKLVTLTVRNSSIPPAEKIDLMRGYFQTLRKHPLFRDVRGGCYTIELKPTANGWHVHIHALLDCPFIPYQKLFSAWRSITGEKCPQIDIHAALTEGQKKYVTKYLCKIDSLVKTPHLVVQLYLAIRGKRLFATFGQWYNATAEEILGQPELENTKAPCPFCATVGSMFMARDGPFLYGNDDWRALFRVFAPDGIICRELQEPAAAASLCEFKAVPSGEEPGATNAGREARRSLCAPALGAEQSAVSIAAEALNAV